MDHQYIPDCSIREYQSILTTFTPAHYSGIITFHGGGLVIALNISECCYVSIQLAS